MPRYQSTATVDIHDRSESKNGGENPGAHHDPNKAFRIRPGVVEIPDSHVDHWMIQGLIRNADRGVHPQLKIIHDAPKPKAAAASGGAGDGKGNILNQGGKFPAEAAGAGDPPKAPEPPKPDAPKAPEPPKAKPGPKPKPKG